MVFLLLNSIYATTQACQIWGSSIHKDFIGPSAMQSSTGSRRWTNKTSSGSENLAVVADDFLTACVSQNTFEVFRVRMKRIFEVVMVVEAKLFVGLDIHRNENPIRLNQSWYIHKGLSDNLLRLKNFHTTPTSLPAKVDSSFRNMNERRWTDKIHRHHFTLVYGVI